MITFKEISDTIKEKKSKNFNLGKEALDPFFERLIDKELIKKIEFLISVPVIISIKEIKEIWQKVEVLDMPYRKDFIMGLVSKYKEH